MLPLRDTNGAFQFAVRVQPAAKREGIAGLYGDAFKIAINAPAVDGKANSALIRYLATIFRVPASDIHIVAGKTSRSKIVRVDGVTATAAASIIASLLPQTTPAQPTAFVPPRPG